MSEFREPNFQPTKSHQNVRRDFSCQLALQRPGLGAGGKPSTLVFFCVFAGTVLATEARSNKVSGKTEPLIHHASSQLLYHTAKLKE